MNGQVDQIADYFDESQMQVTYVKRIGVPIEKVIGEYSGAEIFYEGPESYKPNLPAKTLETISFKKIFPSPLPRYSGSKNMSSR